MKGIKREKSRDKGKKIGIWVLVFLIFAMSSLLPINSPVAATLPSGCTWPVDSPNPTANDYSAYNQIGNYKYHAGIDLTSSLYNPWNYNTPVKAVTSGTVYKIFRTSDTTTTCQGNSISASTNHHGSGNTVIIQHSNGKFTMYIHLDCINNGIVPGAYISTGQVLGIMGNSANVKRDSSFTPHVHFEYKDYGGVGNISDDAYYWGYTPDPPDGYYYYDPRYISCPSFSSSPITKTPIEVTTNGLNVRTGPSTDYAKITQVNSGQKFVAFETSNYSGTWYKVYLPNAGGPAAGWVSGTYVIERPNETQLEVINTGTGGLLIRDSAGGNTLRRWDGTYSVCRNAKIWDGQRFVSLGSQSSWYNYNLPKNYYGSSCQYNPTGPSSGWSSGTYLNVIGGATLSVSLTANPQSGTAPLNGVDLTATVSGTATGTINYTFYCNRSDSGIDITPGYDFKIDNRNPDGTGGTVIYWGTATGYSGGTTFTVYDACNYSSAGTYTAKVIAERGSAPPAEARTTITVNTPSDTTPPNPNPMTWSTQPYATSSTSIAMVATTATDSVSPPVSYFFDYVDSPTGGTGGSDSSWQSSTTYTNSGLQPNYQYGYRVKARDSAPTPNETSPSSTVYKYTLANAPGTAPFSNVTQTSVQANWTANSNRSGTQYYCENTTRGTNSGWTTNTYWNETGLNCGTSYTYRVKAKNGDGSETGSTSLGSQSTQACQSAGTLQFNQSNYPVAENGNTVSITVTRTGGSNGAVSVNYATSNGTAIAGSDYTAASNTLSWANGDTVNKSFTVSITNDNIDETDETFTVTLSNASGGATLGSPSSATVTIMDDDTAGITVTPTSGLVTTEAGGTATFTIKLNSQPTANVTIGLSSSDTTEGTVLPVSVTFTSSNWSVPQTVTVTGVDDQIVDGNVAYTIITAAASSSDPNYNGMNAADVSVTNNDNDSANPPSVVSGPTISNIQYNNFVDSPFTITSVFNDNGSAISNCAYSLNNGSTWTNAIVSGSGASTQCQTTTATCSNGASLTILMKATNANGTTPTGSVSKTCDTSVPVTSDNQTSSNYQSTEKTVTLTPNNGTGSGVTASTGIFGCFGTGCTPSVLGGNSMTTNCGTGNECTYDVRYYSKDNVGNTENTKTSAYQARIDRKAPTSGTTFNVSAGNGQCSLSWDTATDGGSGLHSTQAYEVRYQAGSDPGSCTGGSQAYIGTGLSYNHTPLTNGTTYYYRLCYKDNVSNQSQFSGNPKTCTPQAQTYTLTVNINPTGGGTVTGTGINCPTDCSESYNSGTNVTLTATPNSGYTFGTWSGCDNPSGNTCTMTMNADKGVTAVFDSCSNAPVKIAGTSLYYTSIQEAYNSALDGDIIQIQEVGFTEDINASRDIAVTLEGGYNCDYTTQTGYTTINGSITLNGGPVIIDRIIFQ